MAETASLEDIEDQTSPGVASITDIDDTPPELQKAIASVPMPRTDYMQTEHPLTDWFTGKEPTPVSPEAVEEQKNLEEFRREQRANDKTQIKPSDLAGAMAQAFTRGPFMQETPGDSGPAAAVSQGLQRLGTRGQRTKGALELTGAGLSEARPLAGPAILESAIPMAAWGVASEGTGKGAKLIAKKAGADPETQEYAEQVGQLAPIVAGSLFRPRFGITSTPEGTAGSATVRGAGAGVAVTPEAVTVRGKLGPLEGSKTFTRTPKAEAQPTLTPQTIEGELAARPASRDEISHAQATTNYAGPNEAKAAAVAKRVSEGTAVTIPTQAAAAVGVQATEKPPMVAAAPAEMEPTPASERPTAPAPRAKRPAEPPVPSFGNGAIQTAHISEAEPAVQTAHVSEIEPRSSNDTNAADGGQFKHRSTQINIPEDSEAHQALETTRARISDSDLAAKGKDVGGNHVTVRWGLQAADDDKLEKIKSYLSTVAPFEAKLGKTEKFEPSESSDGAAVIQSPVEAPEMKQIHDELAKHGDFTEPTFNSIAGMIDSLGDSASLRDAMRERGADIVKLLVEDGAITDRERPQFVDTTTGGLSEEGKTFVERALLGSVVDDPRLMDATPKSVLNKLDSSLAALSSLAPRTDAYNILPLIRDALREHAEIASKGIPVEDHLNQSSLFGGTRNPAVDAIVRTLAEKPTLVKTKLRQFAQDANFDVQGQGMLAIGNQPSPADAFNAAFYVDVTQKELENAIIQSAQSDTGVERDRAASNTQEGAGNVQQPATGEARASSQGTTEAGRSEEKTKLIDLLKSESGAFNASKLSPRRLKRGYNRFIDKHIDKTLDMGDKYRRVAEHDPDIALMLKEKDNAPRYVRDKAESNIEQVTKGLTPDQVRYASMLSDSNAREHLEENHPDQFDEAQNDPAVMAAVQIFRQFQDELAQLRIGLGWHVRRDLSVFENEPNAKGRIAWSVLDRDGNEVESFKSHQDAQDYVEENGKILDHLKRVYPEHLREPLMGRTDEAAGLGAPKGGIRPPRPDRTRRLASADYFYEHGAKDFSGYIKSFTQAYHAALNQKIYDSLTDEATRWKEGTALPPQIKYRDKIYYSPDVAKSMKLASPSNRPTQIQEYRAYDPAKDDKALIKDFENGWSTTTTGRPGISPSDRYLAPKEVVEALEHYDTTRGLQENDHLRRFFQDQIVGLFGPNIHVLNIMRRLAHTVGTGAWDPRVWPYYEKLFLSKELRDRMASLPPVSTTR